MLNLLIPGLVVVGVAAAVGAFRLRVLLKAARREWTDRADQALSDWTEANAEVLTTRDEFDAAFDFPTNWKTRRSGRKWLTAAADQWRQQNTSVHDTMLRAEISVVRDALREDVAPDGTLIWPRQPTVENLLSESEWPRISDESNLRAWGLTPDAPQPVRSDFDDLVVELRRESQKQAEETHTELFGSLEAHPMTDNQIEAVTSNESINLVVAGAGSGKTSVMVARAAWLVASGQAEPSEILLLAYNRAAANELRERLENHFGADGSPECRTFHSLGLSVLRDSARNEPQISELADESKLLNFLTEWLGSRAASEESLTEAGGGGLGWYSLATLLCSPASVWSTARGEYGPSPSNPDAPAHIPTAAGHNVRSAQEADITNFLHMLGYHAEYEAPYVVATTGNYQPDWYLGTCAASRTHIYLEHFGIDRQGNTRHDIDAVRYTEEIAWKRDTHRRSGTRLLETFTYDFTETAWHARLALQLWRAELKAQPGVRGESSEFHRCFGKAVRKVAADLAAFIRVARESRPDLDAVRTRVADAEWDPVGGTNEEWTNVRTKLLFDLAEEALKAYEHELSATNTIDYADMCAKAAERLSEEPERASRWGHILVDEFQDITKTRADLIEALLESYDGDATLFAVGDDWQSIYAFAGADVSIMTRFADHFGRRLANTNGTTPASYANVVPLDRTFRFPQNIADVSGRFVMSNRNQLTKTVNARPAETRNEMADGVVVLRYPAPTGDDPDPASSAASRALRGIIRHVSGVEYDRHPTVMFLTRYKHALEELAPASIAAAIPGGDRLKVLTSTIHASKGLEADYVVIVGVITGRWGFPLDNGESVLVRMLLSERSTVPNPEERRLMYVALTRTRQMVMVLAEESAPGVLASPFARELSADPDVRSPEYQPEGATPQTSSHEPQPRPFWEARWSRLRDSGAWGATITGTGVQRGDPVAVTAKGGRVEERTVLKRIWEGDGKSLVALAPKRALDGGPWLPDGCPNCGGDPTDGSTCWETGLAH